MSRDKEHGARFAWKKLWNITVFRSAGSQRATPPPKLEPPSPPPQPDPKHPSKLMPQCTGRSAVTLASTQPMQLSYRGCLSKNAED